LGFFAVKPAHVHAMVSEAAARRVMTDRLLFPPMAPTGAS
jgi:hypothetical protein